MGSPVDLNLNAIEVRDLSRRPDEAYDEARKRLVRARAPFAENVATRAVRQLSSRLPDNRGAAGT